MKTMATDIVCTEPMFIKDTNIILDKLKSYAPWELEGILNTNANIAMKAFMAFQDFHLTASKVPAMFAYDGLVYKHLEPLRLSKQAVEYSQSTMRIISAFYGLLKPLDGIRPYRLEMQSKLRVDGKNLYDFWGDRIYRSLFENEKCVINLASEEYAKIIRKHLKPWDTFIDMVFLSDTKGKKRINTTMAKMARGQMARFILENSIETPELLKAFDGCGFAYEESLSNPNRYVYLTQY